MQATQHAKNRNNQGLNPPDLSIRVVHHHRGTCQTLIPEEDEGSEVVTVLLDPLDLLEIEVLLGNQD